MSRYTDVIGGLVAGRDLSRADSEALMADVLSGALNPVMISALLTALSSKGETADEIAGFAAQMRQHALLVSVDGPVMDTCGTGGSGLPTLNTSTLSAFVIAADGIRVAKHGNRASSGKCGSMDVLEHLGVNIDLDVSQAESLLKNGSIVFLNARRHHPALGPLGPIRRSLGFRTVFNFLGPICNPAQATHQLLGVSDRRRAPLLLDSLATLGTQRALVVAGEDGLDEISLAAPTHWWRLDPDGSRHSGVLRPEDLGLKTMNFDVVSGGDVAQNAAAFEAILRGEDLGPRHVHTALNAGAALYVAGQASTLRSGVERARELLRSGAGYTTFDTYRAASQAA